MALLMGNVILWSLLIVTLAGGFVGVCICVHIQRENETQKSCKRTKRMERACIFFKGVLDRFVLKQRHNLLQCCIFFMVQFTVQGNISKQHFKAYQNALMQVTF